VDEHTFRRFQAVLHVVSAIGAVVVFFVGLQRYHTEQANLLRVRVDAEQWARDREFRSALWLRQIEELSKVADTASRIAVTVTDGELTAFDSTVREYEQLYWGKVTFVDDPDLVRAMDALRHEIRYFRLGISFGAYAALSKAFSGSR
jgi:hypothetical protein